MRYLIWSLCALCALLLVRDFLPKPATIYKHDWAVRAGGAGNDTVAGQRVVTLSDGSAIIAGTFMNAATFGEGEPFTTTLSGTGQAECFLARYQPTGALAWARRAISSSGTITITNIAPTPDGVVIAGTLGAGSVTFTPDQFPMWYTCNSSTSFFARFRGDGSFVSKAFFGGTFIEMDTAANGDVLVFCWSAGAVTFGEGSSAVTVPSTAPRIFALARFNSANQPVWTKGVGIVFGGSYWDQWIQGARMRAYADGGAVITWMMYGNYTIDGVTYTSFDYSDLFLARFNPDGSVRWARSDGGAGGQFSDRPCLCALPDGGLITMPG